MSITTSLAARVESLVGDLSSIRAPRGVELNARQWSTEAPLRMLLNNLDADVAERPEDLVVYGGSGKAARNHDALRAIVAALLELRADETLLVQAGKPVGVFTTHEHAPRAGNHFGGHLDQSGPPRAGETSTQRIALTPLVEELLASRFVERFGRQLGR